MWRDRPRRRRSVRLLTRRQPLPDPDPPFSDTPRRYLVTRPPPVGSLHPATPSNTRYHGPDDLHDAMTTPPAPGAAADLLAVFHAAVREVQTDRLLGRFDLEAALDRPLRSFDHITVLGAGKASMALAGSLERHLAGLPFDGTVTVPHGYSDTFPTHLAPPRFIRIREAGHPLPDSRGLDAAMEALLWATARGRRDLLLAVLSGGGSALWPAPARGLSLDEKLAVTRLLLRSGADIQELNTVRKHLSAIKGGHLARAAAPATVLTLLVSDVVGNEPSVIASGPTAPDPSTFQDAVSILRRYEIWDEIPAGARSLLDQGRQGNLEETPKPGDPAFEHVSTVLLGSNRMALEGAAAEARSRGYETRIVTDSLSGEARVVGERLAHAALRAARTASGPLCLLWGGETTVTVTGDGTGGRNQELALAAALALEDRDENVLLLSAGTDGIDGPTDAAGAWVTPHSAPEARSAGVEPEHYLADNNAYRFFDRVGGLLRTGPTHTNVMDIQIALIRPPQR